MLQPRKCLARLALLVVLTTACGKHVGQEVTRPDLATNVTRMPPVTVPDPPFVFERDERRTAMPLTPAVLDVIKPRPEESPVDYRTFPDWELWRQLGRCEEGGGPAPDGIHWDHNGASYVSGFGMARSTFNMDAHAVGLPPWHVGYSHTDQIKVARYGHYVRHQFWGCSVKVEGW